MPVLLPVKSRYESEQQARMVELNKFQQQQKSQDCASSDVEQSLIPFGCI